MTKEDNLDDTNVNTSQGRQSPLEELQNGGQLLEDQEQERDIQKISDWLSHRVNLIWGQRNTYRVQSWLGVWGLSDGIYCVSGQKEFSQEHEN